MLTAQGRRDLAESHFREAVGADPNSDTAMAELSLCLSGIGKTKEAEDAARRAVELDPEEEINHYALGHALLARGKHSEALLAAKRAIELESLDPHNWHLLGLVHLAEGRHKEVVDAAESGLAHAPDHRQLLTLRTSALTRLGRPQAMEDARRVLAENPQSDIAHCNLGWALLHDGDIDLAIQHFREALRLDPEYGHAREGLLEAMKSRSWLYRPVLKYYLFMQRYSDRKVWYLAGGLIVVFIALGALQRVSPSLLPALDIAYGVLLAAGVFVVFGDALFNLLMRFDPIGRFVLTPRESRLAVWLGIVIGPTAAVFIAAAITDDLMWVRTKFVLIAPAFLLAMLPDIEHKQAARFGDRLAIAIGVVSMLFVVNNLVFPLGLQPFMKTFVNFALFCTAAIWLWSSFARPDQ